MTASDEKPKRGLLGRLFGRSERVPAAQTDAKAIAAAPAPEPVKPVLMPVEVPAEAVQSSEAALVAAPAPALVPDEPEEMAAQSKPLVADEFVPAAPSAIATGPKRSWWQRLRAGLSRSSSAIGQGISDIFNKRKLDTSSLEELEDVLIRADLGLNVAQRISAAVGKGRYEKTIAPEEVKAILAQEVENVLAPVALPLTIDTSKKPFVILVVGVNGSGKTTSIGKLAGQFKREGHSLMLVAGDTFRAAAIEQLRVWGERTGSPVMARAQGSDAASLAFEAIQAAQQDGTDVILMDTAGRLQNRTELMDELEKILRVMKKAQDGAPHAVLLVLDATVGQNALSQVEIFGRVAGVTGLIMTKLDGTARGGILVSIAEKFKLPVHYIGVGETLDDIEPFAARDFARAIAGLEEANV
ncbi:MAG: signal recognition particle-docking protein FtsY [Hyphomicrobiales bacterium]|nr:signal recognition particle-docking protein FtsY [Hyphomicrobiales bacterium]MDE2115761.1 signal recognition particle-docking protein FtsY [Hyphomicrobiales bacterium]